MSSEILTNNAITILKKRYLNGNESIDDMFKRVSLGNETYLNLMRTLCFLPNSPTLFNAGLNNGCTLSACFVFDVEDTMFGKNSIVETREKAIAVAKAGGGVGYYFSNLRAKGQPIKSIHRVACGPVIVLKDYQAISRLITQGGKRDLAQMGVLRCDHPDIEEFIDCKNDNPQEMNSFNISVSWTSEYLNKVDFNIFDKLEKDPNTNINKETKLWIKQCNSAHKTGCPGMLFHDRINKDNWNPHIGMINATNPCVTGDTLILTRNGWVEIQEACDKQVEVWNGKEWSMVTPRLTGTDKEVFRVTTSDGHYLDCTANHGFYLANGAKVTTSTLKIGDKLEKCSIGKATECPLDDNVKLAYLSGFYTGDGHYHKRDKKQAIHFCGEKKIRIGKELANNGLVHLESYSKKDNRQKGILKVKVPKKHTVPLNRSKEYKLLWLSGLLDSDGNIDYKNDIYSYEITSVNKEFLRQVYLMIMELGIKSTCRKHKSSQTKAIKGIMYECKPCYKLYISSNSVVRLINLGLSCRRLTMEDNNPQRNAIRSPKIVSIERIGIADKVYCFTEPKRGRGVFNGILTSNCGETPNRNNEPCNLGSLSLARYVNFKTRKFDYDKLANDTKIAIRFLDDILDVNIFPHPDITKGALLTRKLGLGVMGYADTLALMGIKYASEEALLTGQHIMETISEVAKETSKQLCKEKKPYEGFNDTKTKQSIRRNETVTSIAPTGTIGIIAGVWGGIEPYYHLRCERTTNEGIKMQDGIQDWVHKRLDGFIPDIASEISCEWHIKHQSTFQRYTDLGVSKTINLPNNATVKEVSQAYELLWKLGCKGGTIFRDGCRNEQVLVKSETKSVYSIKTDKIVINTRIKNKLETERRAQIVKFKVAGTEFFLTIGLYPDNTIGEIFLNGSFGSTMTGLLNSFAILFSVSLQNGVPIEELIKHHKNTRFEPCGSTDNKDVPICTSIIDFVVRYIEKKFLIKKDAKIDSVIELKSYSSQDSGLFCPECGSQAIYQSGCLLCPVSGCGWTRCG